MSSAIANRISRLERAAGAQDDEELVEQAWSEEAKDILRGALADVGMSPVEIEAHVNGRQVVQAQMRPLSPEANAVLDQALAELEKQVITA
jgi:hypothetical protein